jgi:hypothetical protein
MPTQKTSSKKGARRKGKTKSKSKCCDVGQDLCTARLGTPRFQPHCEQHVGIHPIHSANAEIPNATKCDQMQPNARWVKILVGPHDIFRPYIYSHVGRCPRMRQAVTAGSPRALTRDSLPLFSRDFLRHTSYIGCMYWMHWRVLPVIGQTGSLLRGTVQSDKGLATKAKVVKPTSAGIDDLVPLIGTQMRGRGIERQILYTVERDTS